LILHFGSSLLWGYARFACRVAWRGECLHLPWIVALEPFLHSVFRYGTADPPVRSAENFLGCGDELRGLHSKASGATETPLTTSGGTATWSEEELVARPPTTCPIRGLAVALLLPFRDVTFFEWHRHTKLEKQFPPSSLRHKTSYRGTVEEKEEQADSPSAVPPAARAAAAQRRKFPFLHQTNNLHPFDHLCTRVVTFLSMPCWARDKSICPVHVQSTLSACIKEEEEQKSKPETLSTALILSEPRGRGR
jgi:hypothetical protein